MINIQKELINLLNYKVTSFTISNELKRIDGEFTLKFIWKANIIDKRFESEWKGFDKPEEAIIDLINTMNKHLIL